MGRGDSLNVLIPASHVYGLILIGLRGETIGGGGAMRKPHIAINCHYLGHPRTQLFHGFRGPLATVFIVAHKKSVYA